MLKIGIVGVGYLGNFHLGNLLSHEDINVVGFYDIDPQRSEFIVEKYKVKSYKNRQELLDNCDALFVVTPTSSHYEITKDALEQGKHVFCEKPITEKIEQAEELMKMAENKHLVLQVGHIERFNPAFTALENYELNPLFIECHRISMFNERGIKSAVIPELMIHDLDIILKIVNSPIKAIEACGAPVLTTTIDMANVRISFENGCIANVTASRVSDKIVRKFRIFQKDAHINIDFLKKSTEIYTLNNNNDDMQKFSSFDFMPDINKTIYYKKLESPEVNAMVEEQKDFISCIKNHKAPLVTGKDGLAALKLALDIEKIINDNLKDANL